MRVRALFYRLAIVSASRAFRRDQDFHRSTILKGMSIFHDKPIVTSIVSFQEICLVENSTKANFRQDEALGDTPTAPSGTAVTTREYSKGEFI